MTRIGIIRCQELATGNSPRRCAGWNCFPAMRNKTKYMDEYETIELVGFDTCGGCPGKGRYDKIVERGLKLKEHGAEVIHLSTCIVLSCPNKDKFAEVLKEKVGLPVKEKTHTSPKGAVKPGQITENDKVSGEAAPEKTVNKPRAKAGTLKKIPKK
jgi:predicted metal-binding protein